jgi:hypothetical protein
MHFPKNLLSQSIFRHIHIEAALQINTIPWFLAEISAQSEREFCIDGTFAADSISDAHGRNAYVMREPIRRKLQIVQ